MKHPASAPTRRRRPSQSRARATADAIRQAFIQLLVEKGYDKVSIREVISVAGVGAGSFYEYFSSKETLAAICIHLRIKEIAAAMRASLMKSSGAPLPERVDALLAAQTEAPLLEAEQWSALFLLERRVSRIEAFRKLYAEFVQMWSELLATGPGWPDGAPIHEAAFAAHSIAYGLVSQALITRAVDIDPVALQRVLRNAVHGYLSLQAPHAYRLYRFDV
jgi:AcrR family transcriptional regulator